MACMGFVRLLSVVTHILWVAAMVLYALAICGPSPTTWIETNYVVQLSTNGTASVNLDLGYLGLCISSPSEGSTTNDTAERLCQNTFGLDKDKEPSELSSDWFDEVDLESPAGDYRDSVSTLLALASVLREDVFSGDDLIAGIVLLFAGGLMVIIPLYWNTGRRRDAFMVVFSALVLGFGFMAAAGAVFSTVRAQELLEGVSPLTTALVGSEPIGAEKGGSLHAFAWGGLIANGVFLFLVCAIGYARRAAQAKGFQGFPGFPGFPGFQGFQGLPIFVQSAGRSNNGPRNGKPPKGRGKFGRGR